MARGDAREGRCAHPTCIAVVAGFACARHWDVLPAYLRDAVTYELAAPAAAAAVAYWENVERVAVRA